MIYTSKPKMKTMKILNKLVLPFLLATVISFIVWRHFVKNNAYPAPAGRTVEYTLKLAGDNRQELEKVLEHFKNDSLKLEAARFLIANMADHYANKWQAYRKDSADSTFSLKPFKNQYDAQPYMDSLQISYRLMSSIPDYSAVRSGFLTRHIEKAFALWEREDNQYLSFDDFKETILPYRVGNAALEDSHQFALDKYGRIFSTLDHQNKLQAAIDLNNHLKNEIKWSSKMNLFPGGLTCEEISDLETGHCDHMVNYGMKIFRAAGIAIGNDYVPAWGDNDAGHSWNVLYLKEGAIPFGGCESNPLEMKFYYRAPKIFRRTFQYQDKGIWKAKNKQQEVPYELSDRYYIDVSSQYFETVDIDVPLKNKPKKGDNCAFLCVYNRARWHPVDWGIIDQDKMTASFSNINDSLLYCVMYYNRMKLKPATSPFWLASSDSLHFFEPKEDKVKLEKIFDYNYYQWNETKADTKYKLLVWKDNHWEKVGEAFSYPCKKIDEEWLKSKVNVELSEDRVSYYIDFDNIPSNGLYRLENDSRPFWIVDGKMAGRFPSKEKVIKKLF